MDLIGAGILGGLVYYSALLFIGLKPKERDGVMRFVRRGASRTSASTG